MGFNSGFKGLTYTVVSEVTNDLEEVTFLIKRYSDVSEGGTGLNLGKCKVFLSCSR